MSIFSTGADFLSNNIPSFLKTLPSLFEKGAVLGQGSIGRSLLGAGAGAVAGNVFSPKAPTYTPVSRAMLDAATIPALQENANRRLANILGAQGAKGGLSSSDLYERAVISQQLARGIGEQRAQNIINAGNSGNQIANAEYNARRQHLQDVMSGAGLGYKIATPVDVEKLLEALRGGK